MEQSFSFRFFKNQYPKLNLINQKKRNIWTSQPLKTFVLPTFLIAVGYFSVLHSASVNLSLDCSTWQTIIKLLWLFQFAYCEHHSTKTALVCVGIHLMPAFGQDHILLLSIFNLLVAFDTHEYNILLQQLHVTFGFSGGLLKWFQSYLKDCIQSMIISDLMSTPIAVKYGVPQSSVFTPVLFGRYVQPLGPVIPPPWNLVPNLCYWYIVTLSGPVSELKQLVITTENSVNSVKQCMKTNYS